MVAHAMLAVVMVRTSSLKSLVNFAELLVIAHFPTSLRSVL
jgi:hypothetical protein